LAVPLALAGFALFTAELRFASGMWPKGTEPNPIPRGPHEYREVFERVVRMSDSLDALRGGRRVYFWYDENEPNRSEYWALNSVYMYVYSRISGTFPADACAKPVDPGSLVVIATRTPSWIAQGREKLAECWSPKGMRPVPVAPDSKWEYITPYTLSVMRAETQSTTPTK